VWYSWQIHGRVRRYTSPDEHAFYPDAVPALVLPPLTYPKVTQCPDVHAHIQSPSYLCLHGLPADDCRAFSMAFSRCSTVCCWGPG